MNKRDGDILYSVFEKGYINQRFLSSETGYSIGSVNIALNNLCQNGYLDRDYVVTNKAIQLVSSNRPRHAIILAAGFGMRMIPINLETPKALLEVKGERLIDRLIKQLHEAGIYSIDVVVGFMKEQFEYLIDLYGVNLLVNTEYAKRNNMFSLYLAVKNMRDENTYVLPCDIWCRNNPFRKNEIYSWYMVSKELNPESEIRVTRSKELVCVPAKEKGNRMIGIAYLLAKDFYGLRNRLEELVSDLDYQDAFWERAVIRDRRMLLNSRIIEKQDDIVEINTYEQLRELDQDTAQLKSEALEVIANVFHVDLRDICNIHVLKKGMTNRSFVFQCRSEKYIMRIPGEGTDRLINRRNEANVYQVIAGKGLCDDVVYINPENGYKITKYLNNIRTCDPYNPKDLIKCMTCLKAFHQMKLEVSHSFDIFEQIEKYERLWGDEKSIYSDYYNTKTQVFRLKTYIDMMPKEWCLTHIDAVPDNFLFYRDKEGNENLQLTDWEYAAMQDPHVDVAMFCIYSMYGKQDVDRLIDLYFNGNCRHETKVKIYCYIAACGLLWSNWCEFKRNLGVEFGEYALRQYRFAKDYYHYAVEEMDNLFA